MKLFLILFFSIFTFGICNGQYLYEEIPFMWQHSDTVSNELISDGYELTKTGENEGCILFWFKKEPTYITFECCNDTQDSITNIQVLSKNFNELLDLKSQLTQNPNFSQIDTSICDNPTAIFSDELDYEMVLVYNSKGGYYTYQLNYYPNFEFFKEN